MEFLAIIVFALGIVIAYKAYLRSDYTLWVNAATKVLLSVVILFPGATMLFSPAILISFFADLVVGVLFIFSNKMKIEIENTRMRDALERLADKNYFLVQNSLIGIYMVDFEGKFELVSPALAEGLGFTSHELEGKSIYEILPENSKEIVKEKINLKRNSDETTCYEIDVYTKQRILKKARVFSKRFKNGHWAITGYIQFLDEDGECGWKQ